MIAKTVPKRKTALYINKLKSRAPKGALLLKRYSSSLGLLRQACLRFCFFLSVWAPEGRCRMAATSGLRATTRGKPFFCRRFAPFDRGDFFLVMLASGFVAFGGLRRLYLADVGVVHPVHDNPLLPRCCSFHRLAPKRMVFLGQNWLLKKECGKKKG